MQYIKLKIFLFIKYCIKDIFLILYENDIYSKIGDNKMIRGYYKNYYENTSFKMKIKHEKYL